MIRKKIAYFSSVFGIANNMKGIGYRVWELANVMGNYTDVSVVTPNGIDQLLGEKKNARVTFFKREDVRLSLSNFISEHDIIIFEQDEEMSILLEAYKQRKFIVLDSLIYPIEYLQMDKIFNAEDREKVFYKKLQKYLLEFYLADCTIAGTYEERLILLGTLVSLGRVNFATYFDDKKLDTLIKVLSIGYSRDYNEKKLFGLDNSNDDRKFTLLWNGGIWNHYDPSVIIHAIKHLETKDVDASLLFMYYSVNNPTTTAMQIKELSEELGLLGKSIVFNEKPVYFDNRVQYLESAKAIICMFQREADAENSLRLRFRDCLLYEKPVITADYGLLATYVTRYSLGVTADPYEAKDLAEAIRRVCFDNIVDYAQNIRAVKENFMYENTVPVFLNGLAEAHVSPDKYTQQFEAGLDRLLKEIN